MVVEEACKLRMRRRMFCITSARLLMTWYPQPHQARSRAWADSHACEE